MKKKRGIRRQRKRKIKYIEREMTKKRANDEKGLKIQRVTLWIHISWYIHTNHMIHTAYTHKRYTMHE